MPRAKSKHTDTIWVRIDSVIGLILENDRYLNSKRVKELCSIISEKFDVSKRTAERYIVEAKREISKLGKKDTKKAFKKAIHDREFLLQKAKGVKDDKGYYQIKPDFKLALEIVKDRDKLNGLYFDEIKQTGEITIRNVDLSKFTEFGLERLKRGDKIEEVLMDPKSVKQE
ncbi:MAG: hypothetical protein KKB34_04985 [Bacteroidetes bacterium]|nr:hypothetical protein [Bacteroidota bacterium]